MPRKTEWIHRIPGALEVLGQSSAPLIDRADIQNLFGVSARHAVRLLHRLGASEAGKNLFIGRGDLIGRLVAIHRGEDAAYERRRLQRLDGTLAELGRSLRARQVPVAVTPAALGGTLASLPSSVRLGPGRLEIDFETPQELLARLFELSQALAADYEAFEQLAGAGG